MMNRKSASVVIIILFIVVAVSLYVYFESDAVPDNYSSIQSAVDAASAGDTVYIKSGTYNENLVIDKPLSLVGEDKDSTIITAETDGPTITIEAENVTVTGFTIRSLSSETGVYVGAENCTIIDNIIEGCGTGIYNQGSAESFFQYINIKNNTVRNNVEAGIVFEGTPFIFNITGNTITSNSIGIRAADSYRCLIINNTISENIDAIDAAGTRLDILNNTITDNTETAITIHNTSDSSDLIRIWYNNIQNSKKGMTLIQDGRNSIIKNNINKCTTGINFSQTGSSTVYENNITDSTIGIIITQSSHITLRQNNLINNTQQAVTDANSTIQWDSSEKGNYWSDYTTRYPNANETDNTGIWDTPYIINENNTDNYPLANPHILDS